VDDPDYEHDPHANSFGDGQRSSSSSSGESEILASAGANEEDEDIEALGLRDYIEASGARIWDKSDL
jgi:hypothetical protein